MSSIVFTTPTIIPEIAITTLGINAKEEGTNPTGFFGTGLKYAIAIILRHGEAITIYSDGNAYKFGTTTEVIRGKEFHIVTMATNNDAPIRLGFTTELGKNWQLWQAYRELYSNTIDENGTIEELSALCSANSDTHIIVSGSQFSQVHAQRRKWFLDTAELGKPWEQDRYLEIYSPPAAGIFYRGIMVFETPTLHTYNFTQKISLSEDRIAHDVWELGYKINKLIAIHSNSSELITSITCAPEASWEARQSLSHLYEVGPKFMRVVEALRNQHNPNLRKDALALYLKNCPTKAIEPTALTRLESAMLSRALAVLPTIGITIDDSTPIVVTESLGENVLGKAQDNTIYIARTAFHMGTKILAGTIMEEWIHLIHKHDDCARSMQNYLINLIMTLAEEIRGEPI